MNHLPSINHLPLSQQCVICYEYDEETNFGANNCRFVGSQHNVGGAECLYLKQKAESDERTANILKLNGNSFKSDR